MAPGKLSEPICFLDRRLDLSQTTPWPVTGPVPGSGPATVALLPPATPPFAACDARKFPKIPADGTLIAETPGSTMYCLKTAPGHDESVSTRRSLLADVTCESQPTNDVRGMFLLVGQSTNVLFTATTQHGTATAVAQRLTTRTTHPGHKHSPRNFHYYVVGVLQKNKKKNM